MTEMINRGADGVMDNEGLPLQEVLSAAAREVVTVEDYNAIRTELDALLPSHTPGSDGVVEAYVDPQGRVRSQEEVAALQELLNPNRYVLPSAQQEALARTGRGDIARNNELEDDPLGGLTEHGKAMEAQRDYLHGLYMNAVSIPQGVRQLEERAQGRLALHEHAQALLATQAETVATPAVKPAVEEAEPANDELTGDALRDINGVIKNMPPSVEMYDGLKAMKGRAQQINDDPEALAEFNRLTTDTTWLLSQSGYGYAMRVAALKEDASQTDLEATLSAAELAKVEAWREADPDLRTSTIVKDLVTEAENRMALDATLRARHEMEIIHQQVRDAERARIIAEQSRRDVAEMEATESWRAYVNYDFGDSASNVDSSEAVSVDADDEYDDESDDEGRMPINLPPAKEGYMWLQAPDGNWYQYLEGMANQFPITGSQELAVVRATALEVKSDLDSEEDAEDDLDEDDQADKEVNDESPSEGARVVTYDANGDPILQTLEKPVLPETNVKRSLRRKLGGAVMALSGVAAGATMIYQGIVYRNFELAKTGADAVKVATRIGQMLREAGIFDIAPVDAPQPTGASRIAHQAAEAAPAPIPEAAPQLPAVQDGERLYEYAERIGVPRDQIMNQLDHAAQVMKEQGQDVVEHGSGRKRWWSVGGKSDTASLVQLMGNFLSR